MREISLVIQPEPGIDASKIEAALHSIDALGIDLIGLTGDPSYRSLADRLGLVWLPDSHVGGSSEFNTSGTTTSDSTTENAESVCCALVVQGPIRSGVQIYAKDRDLVVMGHVSAGAEVMADGHIHVYGRLIGRAAAGVTGQPGASVFCQCFEPQLVSVAGVYVGSEQIPEEFHGASVRVSLEAGGQALSYTVLL